MQKGQCHLVPSSWMSFICFAKASWSLNPFPHLLHLILPLMPHLFKCLVNLSELANEASPHIPHLNGLIPVCGHMMDSEFSKMPERSAAKITQVFLTLFIVKPQVMLLHCLL